MHTELLEDVVLQEEVQADPASGDLPSGRLLLSALCLLLSTSQVVPSI